MLINANSREELIKYNWFQSWRLCFLIYTLQWETDLSNYIRSFSYLMFCMFPRLCGAEILFVVVFERIQSLRANDQKRTRSALVCYEYWNTARLVSFSLFPRAADTLRRTRGKVPFAEQSIKLASRLADTATLMSLLHGTRIRMQRSGKEQSKQDRRH